MINKNLFKHIYLYFGATELRASKSEVVATALTSVVGITCVLYFAKLIGSEIGSTALVDQNSYVVTSIAATAVLVFAVPHGTFSQPWPVIGGHLISAILGVTSATYIENNLLAAIVAVSLAILLMQQLRCIHPPGGATALGAVFSEDVVSTIGYGYVLYPTLVSCVTIVLVAFAVNYLFNWRRYPAHLFFRNSRKTIMSPADRKNEITNEDFFKALQDHGSYIDLSAEAWMDIFDKAANHAEVDSHHPEKIQVQRSYSNGKLGINWQIRKVLYVSKLGKVHYKVIEGMGKNERGVCTKANFITWAKFEVRKNAAGLWQKLAND